MKTDTWNKCEEFTMYFYCSWIWTNLDQIIVASFLHAVFIFLFTLDWDEKHLPIHTETFVFHWLLPAGTIPVMTVQQLGGENDLSV